jgi:hypothetical protein
MNARSFEFPSKDYGHLGRCAYCPETTNLSKEHIIAFGLGSNLVVHSASCEKCRAATSKVEDFVLRKYVCALRSFLSLPSRKPHQRPDGYKLALRRAGRAWTQKVPLDKHPGVIRFVMFDPPGRVSGRPPVQETFNVRLIDAQIFPDMALRLARLGADAAEDRVTMNAMMLARMLSKIGHAFAVAELGLEAFEETYVTHLVRAEASDWNYWVGGFDRGKDIESSTLHELRLLRRGADLSVIVHLFVPYCQRHAYEIIVGRLRHDVRIPSELDEAKTAA